MKPATADQWQEILAQIADRLPDGWGVEVWLDEWTGGDTTLNASGTATGASTTAAGDKMADAVAGTAGTVDLRAGQASTGTADRQTTGTAWGTTDGIGTTMLIIAAVFGLGAALAWWQGLRRLALALGIAAVGFVSAAQFPALAPLILLGALAAAVLPTLLADGRAARLGHAIRGTVSGIERARQADPEAVERIEPHLSARMDDRDKAVIKQVKAELSK